MGEFISGLGISCATLDEKRRPSGVQTSLDPSGFSEGTPFDDTCAEGLHAIGVETRAGILIDAIGLACD